MLTKIASSVLDRSVTRGLDAANMPIGDYNSFIAILGEMKYPGIKVNEVLNHPGSLIAHLFFSFIIIATQDDFETLALDSKMSATIVSYAPAQCMGIVSGSLEQWRTAVINCCVPYATKNLRDIFNQIFKEFEKLKLNKLWLDFIQIDNKDGTFLLKEK